MLCWLVFRDHLGVFSELLSEAAVGGDDSAPGLHMGDGLFVVEVCCRYEVCAHDCRATADALETVDQDFIRLVFFQC